MAAAKTKAQTIINENGVVVFSKSYCPYCNASKQLLNELGANYTALELDELGMFPFLFSLLSLFSSSLYLPFSSSSFLFCFFSIFG